MSHLIDLAPLRESPAFARLFLGAAVAGIGTQLTVVAVGLEVYDITRSTFAVSLVGGIALGPMIVAGLYGGVLADRFDRKIVMTGAALIAWLSTIALAISGFAGLRQVWLLYLLAALISVGGTVLGSSRSASYPRLLPLRLIPAVGALSGVSIGVQLTVGPALGGVLVATVGFGWTYLVDVLLFLGGFAGIAALPRLPPIGQVAASTWHSVREGLAFLRRSPNIRMSFIVDIVAMTFGRPNVLFPAAGALVFGGGPVTVGVLTAAGAIGTILSGLFSGAVGRVRRQGVAIGAAITVYGAFVALFGATLLVTTLSEPAGDRSDPSQIVWPALLVGTLALAGTGASDNISSIFRSTILQVAAPDSMRGRLQAIFIVVVAGGPRLGDLYAGIAAAGIALWAPPLFGGLVIIVVIVALLRAVVPFRTYDAAHPMP